MPAENGNTPIFYAITCEALELLLRNGAKINWVNNRWQTVLLYLLSHDELPGDDFLWLLLLNECSVDIPGYVATPTNIVQLLSPLEFCLSDKENNNRLRHIL